MDPIKNEEVSLGPAEINDTVPTPQPSSTSPTKQVLPKANDRTQEEEKICRKYIWGTCDKHQSLCRFLHVRDIPYMKKILRFCNDFQNHGCSWPNCTYLHTSREEKNLFINYDKIPQILVERYAKMEAKALSLITPKPSIVGELGEPGQVAPNSAGTIRVIAPETVTQLPRVTVSRPFPPPVVITTAPPQATITAPQTTMAPQLNITQANINPMTLNPQLNLNQPLGISNVTQSPLILNPTPSMVSLNVAKMVMPVQNPPVAKQNLLIQNPLQTSPYSSSVLPNSAASINPLIPKLPSSSPISQLSSAANGQNFISGQFPVNLKQPPPPIPVGFDKTKPPPIFPISAAASKDIGPPAKRICIGLPDATTTCRNEADGTQEDSELCVDCTQRRLSIDIFNKQIEKLMCEQNEKEIMYQQKLENLLNSKKSFLSIVGTEHKNVIEKYIDGSLDISSTLLMQTIMSSGRFSMVRKSNQSQLLPKLIESLLISNNNKDIREDYINNSVEISNLSQPNVTRHPELVPPQSSQVQTMNQMLQQLITLSGSLLINNQMNPNSGSATMPTSNAVSPISNAVNTLTNNQTQTTPLVSMDNGQVNIPSRLPQPEQTLRMYDPNMPPPNFSYYPTPSFIQPNGPPNSMPPNTMPQNMQIPFQGVMHHGPYPLPGPGIPQPGNPHMPQGPGFPPSMMPPGSAPLPPNLPPQQPAPPPEQLLYPQMTPYYYPSFH